jgi:hypothetical protein
MDIEKIIRFVKLANESGVDRLYDSWLSLVGTPDERNHATKAT